MTFESFLPRQNEKEKKKTRRNTVERESSPDEATKKKYI